MNRLEFAPIWQVLRHAFPGSFVHMSAAEEAGRAGVYADALEEYAAIVVHQAAHRLIRSELSGFMPPVGTMREACFEFLWAVDHPVWEQVRQQLRLRVPVFRSATTAYAAFAVQALMPDGCDDHVLRILFAEQLDLVRKAGVDRIEWTLTPARLANARGETAMIGGPADASSEG